MLDLDNPNFVPIIIGAIIAGILSRSKCELSRASYFAYMGLLTFIAATTLIFWSGSVSAMTGGYLRAFMIVDVITWFVFGYFFGVIAIARSRDAYGHPRMAVLAFIPFVNLWFLLKQSKNKVLDNRIPTTFLLTGGLGVLFGFVMFGARITLMAYVGHQTGF